MSFYSRSITGYILIAISIVTFFQCYKNNEYLLSPNEITPDQPNVDDYLNYVQVEVPKVVAQFARPCSRLMHMEAMTQSYNYDFTNQPVELNSPWEQAYKIILTANKGEALALKYDYFKHYMMFKVLKSYLLICLVDIMGDIPYSEAAITNITEPKLDKGEDIYKEVIKMLNDALDKIIQPVFKNPEYDLYYNNDGHKWIKCINSLKLKCFLQTRFINPSAIRDSINVIITKKLISNPEDDFQFFYGHNIHSPDSRHPLYNLFYNVNSIIQIDASNDGMNRIYENNYDPRWRFLLYRQINLEVDLVNKNNLPCSNKAKPNHYNDYDVFCSNGVFIGKDHGDNSAKIINPRIKTLFGLYPIGGAFDENKFKNIDSATTAKGNGVFPMITSSFVKLYRAEAALFLNTNDAENTIMLYEGAINDFSEKLLNFKNVSGFSSPITIDNSIYSNGYYTTLLYYVTQKKKAFEASNKLDKLSLIIDEFFKNAWGNGLEVYNNYRRTGYPSNFQPLLFQKTQTDIPKSFYYPEQAVLYNRNINQKVNLYIPVFWDKN